MMIKNILDASDEECTCGSWLRHWKKYSGQNVVYCPVTDCYNKDLVGAHVQIISEFDDKHYIFPLCKKHSMWEKDLEVSDSYFLVSAVKSETCAKL